MLYYSSLRYRRYINHLLTYLLIILYYITLHYITLYYIARTDTITNVVIVQYTFLTQHSLPTICSLALPAMEHWDKLPLDFQQFNFFSTLEPHKV